MVENESFIVKVLIGLTGFLVGWCMVMAFVYAKDKEENKQHFEQIELQLQGQQTVYMRLMEKDDEFRDTDQLIMDRLDDLEDSEMDLLEFEVQVEMRQLQGITDEMEYFIAYKDIMERYSDYFGEELSIYDIYTPEEINYLQKVVETETFGADFESKTHVANVVLNRIESPLFPNDMISVITAPSQFAYFRTNISDVTKLACEYAVMMPDNTDGAIAFHSGPTTPTFWGREFIFTDAVHHSFYK